MEKLPLDRHLSTSNVRKVVSEADGYQPHLVAPEQGYRRLIDGSLGFFKGPAEATVDAVIFCSFWCYFSPIACNIVYKEIGASKYNKKLKSRNKLILIPSAALVLLY